MVGLGIVGGQFLNLSGRIVILEGEIVIDGRGIGIGADYFEILHAGLAIGIEEVDMVHIETIVHDTADHALARIGLRETDALVDSIDACGLTGVAHLMVHLAVKLKELEKGECGHARCILEGHRDKDEIADGTEHVHALSLDIFNGLAVGQACDGGSVLRLCAKYLSGSAKLPCLLGEGRGASLKLHALDGHAVSE